MRWEEGEFKTRAGTRTIFFSPFDVFFFFLSSFFSTQEAHKCLTFIILLNIFFYCMRYVLSPRYALSPRSLRNNDAICFLDNVLKQFK